MISLFRVCIVLASLYFAVSVGIAQTILLRVRPVYFEKPLLPADIQIFCTEHYEHSACLHDATTLHRALSSYPVYLLGGWSYVLAPAEEWKDLLRSLRAQKDTPAFSILDARVTVLESSLFSATPERVKDLLLEFGLAGKALLELAIRHELVHGVCQDKNEWHIEAHRQDFKQGKPMQCSRVLARVTP